MNFPHAKSKTMSITVKLFVLNKPLFIFYQNPSMYNGFLLFSTDLQVLCFEAHLSDKA